MKVIILCGGKGKTLWPISRESVPKQFSKTIFDRSLFQRTLSLWIDYIPPEDIFAVAPQEFKFFIKSQSIEVSNGVPVNQIFEKKPEGTLKAVATALLNLTLSEVKDYEIVVIMNSDQIWKVSKEKFLEMVKLLSDSVVSDRIILLASTKSKSLKDSVEIDFNSRKDSYLKNFLGFSNKSRFSNVGFYVSSLKGFKDLIQMGFSKSLESIIEDGEMSGIAFEQAISKMSDRCLVYTSDIEVVDIDSIEDISNLVNKDKDGNFFSGDIVSVDTKNSIVVSTKRLVAVEGVKNLNIIETPDVVYISSKDSKNSLVSLIKDREEVKSSTTEYRPWGSYTVIEKGANYQIKKIVVNPGESLSLQLHYHRSEHWVVVKGTAKVTVGDNIIYLRENESTFIPKTVKHRLENPGKIPLEIIEIQIGEYISEDDIVRFSDIYGRSE